jgi:hypothetical protein
MPGRQQKIAAIAHQRGVQARQAHLDAVGPLPLVPSRIRLLSDLPNNISIGAGSWRGGELARHYERGPIGKDIQRLWTGDESIDAHSSVLQLMLAKAALYDRAQERAHQVRQTNLPQVIRPGTYRRASDGDAQSVGELTARLAKASGREAIRLGTALTKARRALNGG